MRKEGYRRGRWRVIALLFVLGGGIVSIRSASSRGESMPSRNPCPGAAAIGPLGRPPRQVRAVRAVIVFRRAGAIIRLIALSRMSARLRV